MIRLLVREGPCNTGAGLERSENGDRNCWKNQVKEEGVLDQDVGSGMPPSRWILGLFRGGVDRTW